ncbi:MAG TPA: hypothetical protein PK299_13110 [Anaerolineales bacterium]|nr:hypothetical protein [Anaerolineales bacterium]
MTLNTRRILVWSISILLGTALSSLIVFVMFATTLPKYGVPNFVMLLLSIGAFFWIWLDLFLGSDMMGK